MLSKVRIITFLIVIFILSFALLFSCSSDETTSTPTISNATGESLSAGIIAPANGTTLKNLVWITGTYTTYKEISTGYPILYVDDIAINVPNYEVISNSDATFPYLIENFNGNPSEWLFRGVKKVTKQFRIPLDTVSYCSNGSHVIRVLFSAGKETAEPSITCTVENPIWISSPASSGAYPLLGTNTYSSSDSSTVTSCFYYPPKILEPKYHIATYIYDNKLIALGGIYPQPSNKNDEDKNVEIFDLTTNFNYSLNSWDRAQERANPNRTKQYAHAMLDGKIYLFGGIFNYLSDELTKKTIEAYDITDNRWSTIADTNTSPENMMYKPRASAAAVVYHNKIYLTGGYYLDPTSNQKVLINNVDIYDPSLPTTSKWLPEGQGNNINNIRYNHAVTVSDDKIFIIGGRTDILVDQCEYYSETVGEWKRGSNLNRSRELPAVVTMPNNDIYVIGGNDISNEFINSVERFSEGIWQFTPNLINIAGETDGVSEINAALDSSGKRVWIVGGYSTSLYDKTTIYLPYNDHE